MSDDLTVPDLKEQGGQALTSDSGQNFMTQAAVYAKPSHEA